MEVGVIKNVMLNQRIIVAKVRIIWLRDWTDPRLAAIWKDLTIKRRKAEGIKFDGHTYVVVGHLSGPKAQFQDRLKCYKRYLPMTFKVVMKRHYFYFVSYAKVLKTELQ